MRKIMVYGSHWSFFKCRSIRKYRITHIFYRCPIAFIPKIYFLEIIRIELSRRQKQKRSENERKRGSRKSKHENKSKKLRLDGWEIN